MAENTINNQATGLDAESAQQQPSATVQEEPVDVKTQIVDVSGSMLLQTWVAFIIVLVVLGKLLWKPVLRALEKREGDIKESLEQAERARTELAESGVSKQRILAEAGRVAEEKIRAAATEAERIKEEARQEAANATSERLKKADEQIAIEASETRKAVHSASVSEMGALLERILSQDLSEEQKEKYQKAMLHEVEL